MTVQTEELVAVLIAKSLVTDSKLAVFEEILRDAGMLPSSDEYRAMIEQKHDHLVDVALEKGQSNDPWIKVLSELKKGTDPTPDAPTEPLDQHQDSD